MKQKNPVVFAQPITRVHNIFRIRTIVNAVSEENTKKRLPSDEEIGVVLAKRGLSKYRKEKIKDRIMRRARDHLLTASYMGLLTRTGRPFGYSSTTSGKALMNYGPEVECPKDTMEEAIFINRILRLKLTNVYDLQLGKQYVDLRSRPCLYALYVLAQTGWLHEHQIAVALGGKRCDPVLADNQARLLVSSLDKYAELETTSLKDFYSDFGVKDSDRKNMTRNIRPLLDWCESIGLVVSRGIENIGRWYSLTDRGKTMLGLYGKKIPVWFSDLGATASAKAALLLFCQYAIESGFVVRALFDSKIVVGLVTRKISTLMHDIENDLGMTLHKDGGIDDIPLDFTLEYDVPPESRNDVTAFLKNICKMAHLKPEIVLRSLETGPIENLEKCLEREQQQIRTLVTGKFSERMAISSDPLLSKISSVIPSVGVLGQYKSDFEKEVVILLRLLGLNAVKYQGQLADRSHKTHIIRFFENNPDILVINGIESLIECKSSGEWKSPLTTVKSVPKEFLIYQQYFPEVASNSIAIVYEGSLDTDSHKFIVSILEDSQDVVFITKNYLINCIYQLHFRERLLEMIKQPKKFKAEEKVLIAQ